MAGAENIQFCHACRCMTPHIPAFDSNHQEGLVCQECVENGEPAPPPEPFFSAEWAGLAARFAAT